MTPDARAHLRRQAERVKSFVCGPEDAEQLAAGVLTLLADAERAEPRPAQEWQLIKTAPKDGTRILGVDRDGWIAVCVHLSGPDWCYGVSYNEIPLVFRPTYWMPLFALPEVPHE